MSPKLRKPQSEPAGKSTEPGKPEKERTMNEINSTHDIDTSTTSMTDADPHRGWLDERDAKLAYQ